MINPTKLVKGSRWRLTQNTVFAGVQIPAGTEFEVAHSRKPSAIPVAIKNNERLSKEVSNAFRNGKNVFPKYGFSKRYSRFKRADAVVPLTALRDLLFVGGENTEYYIRGSSGFVKDGFLLGKKFVGDIRKADYFVTDLSAMRAAFIANQMGDDVQIVEYDPFNEVFTNVEVNPDWLYSVRKLTEYANDREKRAFNPRSPSKMDIEKFRDSLMPNVGRLAGFGYLISGLRGLLRKHNLDSAAILNSIVGFTEKEDLFLLKVIEPSVEVFFFDE